MRGLVVSLLCAVHSVHSVPSSDFLVIHIGDEAGAGQYDSRFLVEIPPAALSESEAYLVLRRVPFTAFPDAKDDPDPRMRIAALSDDSYIGIAPVSLRQWRQVTGEDVSGEEISPEEWNRFIRRLNDRTGLLQLHLATEHQWEALRRDGSVGDVVIVEGNDKTLDQAVLRALWGSRFAPGEVNGVPVDVRVRIRIPFRREEEADEAASPDTERPIRRRR